MQNFTEDCQQMKRLIYRPIALQSCRTLMIAVLLLVSLFQTERLYSQGIGVPPQVPVDNQPTNKKNPVKIGDAPPEIPINNQPEVKQPVNNGDPTTQIPAGADIPGKPPAIMFIKKELITLAEEKELKKIKLKASKALLNGTMSIKDKQNIKKWIKLYILPMTLEENRRKLTQMRHSLRQGITKGAKKVSNKSRAETFRRFFLQEIATQCEALFDNNFHVRLAAVLIINDLNIVEATASGDPPKPFVQAYSSLLKIIRDEKQHEAIKIVATQGLKRIVMVRKPGISGSIKQEIAKAVMKELSHNNNSSWYNQRLVQVLSRIDTMRWLGAGGIAHPYIMQTLIKTMKDNKRSWQVRAEAAKGLGLIPLDKSKEMNPKMLASEVVRFCEEMSIAYNKQPQHRLWVNHFFNALLAFRPKNQKGVLRGDGLLFKSNNNPDVKKAHDLILPVVRHVLHQPKGGKYQKIDKVLQQTMSEWLKKSPGNTGVPSTALPTGKASNVTTVQQ